MLLTTKERLIHFLEVKAISKAEFARKIDVSAAYVTSMRKSIQPDKIKKIAAAFPELNISWLLTGEGSMLQSAEVEAAAEAPAAVPLYSLQAVAGMAQAGEQQEYVEETIAWHGARPGDFAVRVCGASMAPRIPSGSLLLLRPYAFDDWHSLEFGRVHVVVASDGRAYVKTLRADGDSLLLHSENPDYPDVLLPPSSVRRLYLAVSVQHPL